MEVKLRWVVINLLLFKIVIHRLEFNDPFGPEYQFKLEWGWEKD